MRIFSECYNAEHTTLKEKLGVEWSENEVPRRMLEHKERK
jgi:hypothetical protein